MTDKKTERLYRILVAAARAIVEEDDKARSTPTLHFRQTTIANGTFGLRRLYKKPSQPPAAAAPAAPPAEPPAPPVDEFAIAGLPSDHPALLVYRPLCEQLVELTDTVSLSPQKGLQGYAAALWAEFLELKQFAGDPHYPLIRDHLRSQIKPRFAALIAACEPIPNE
jgi:hypothetical protein